MDLPIFLMLVLLVGFVIYLIVLKNNTLKKELDNDNIEYPNNDILHDIRDNTINIIIDHIISITDKKELNELYLIETKSDEIGFYYHCLIVKRAKQKIPLNQLEYERILNAIIQNYINYNN